MLRLFPVTRSMPCPFKMFAGMRGSRIKIGRTPDRLLELGVCVGLSCRLRRKKGMMRIGETGDRKKGGIVWLEISKKL
jgi:hypothetical protein